MKVFKLVLGFVLVASLLACGNKTESPISTEQSSGAVDDFQYEVDRFADMRILRYQVPGFETLDFKQKKLAYYLYQAALSGRDIMWDQNFRYNLAVRRTLEEMVKHYSGDRNKPDWQALMTYTKQVWFANGIHHHYSNDKFIPAFNCEEFKGFAAASNNAQWPLGEGQTTEQLLLQLCPIIFDPTVAPRKVNKTLGVDKVASSSVNFYRNLTDAEVADYYADRVDPSDTTPISYGLNSRLVKTDKGIEEQVWKVGGLYGAALEEVAFWLDKAITVTENGKQSKALELLAQYFRSGDLKDFDAYNIAWVNDVDSRIDVVNGFIEVYNDPLGYRGSFESVVSLKDLEASKRIGAIAAQAQWFENNAPLMPEHKKTEVKGIVGKAITVIVESGDASPSSPIGINLPNAGWIRANHGSKSVTLSNLMDAHEAASGKATEEFAWDEAEITRAKAYGALAFNLHVDMHEVIGHASGQVEPGVGTTKETLKQYASSLEEGRADLVALYYAMDPKLVEIGVMPNLEPGRAEYDRYIRSGLMQQLYRIKSGDSIEESHMQNRAWISHWVMEKGAADKVIERKSRNGKTYFVVNNYDKLRQLFGQLLGEVQRIKSQGDFKSAKHLVETYGVKVDPVLHEEVLARYATLDVAAYSGFLNPRLIAIEEGGEIIDVVVAYVDSFEAQMLEYARHYSFLPTVN